VDGGESIQNARPANRGTNTYPTILGPFIPSNIKYIMSCILVVVASSPHVSVLNGQRVEVMVRRSKGSRNHFFLFCAWRFEECGRNISICTILYYVPLEHLYITHIIDLIFCPGLRHLRRR